MFKIGDRVILKQYRVNPHNTGTITAILNDNEIRVIFDAGLFSDCDATFNKRDFEKVLPKEPDWRI